MKNQESGFTHDGRFYPWNITDKFSDLLLIERLTGGMPADEFYRAVNDPHEQKRPSIQIAMIATSLRHGNPDWSVEYLVRACGDISLTEIAETFVGGDPEEDDETGPPAEPAPSGPNKDDSGSKTVAYSPASKQRKGSPDSLSEPS